MADVIPAWRRSLTCEVGWTSTPERPGALAAVPLLWGEAPCIALPYSYAERAEPLRSATVAAFVVADTHASPPTTLAAIGPMEVVDDLGGDRFCTDLLPQELLKYPPSRIYADSPMLRRENWWWLPRIMVRLTRVDRVVELPVRARPAQDALLVRDDGMGLRLDVVAPADPGGWPAPRVRLHSPDRELRGDGARVLAFGHDYSMPDLERWEPWSVRGVLRGDELIVTERQGSPDTSLAPLGLMQRIRRQRELGRACRKGLARAERSRS